MSARSTVHIYLRGGAVVSVVVDEITVSKSRLDNKVTGLKWTNAKPDLFFIDLDEIVTVTVGDAK